MPTPIVRKVFAAECSNCGELSSAYRTADEAEHTDEFRIAGGIPCCDECATAIESEES